MQCAILIVSYPHSVITTQYLIGSVSYSASSLASYVGYGNVAGFLFNKGILNAPPRPTSGGAGPTLSPNGQPIDPITGTVKEELPPLEMTDEEKEREAEKLFVLFDRLERSGAMPPSQNPIRKAVAEGKLG